MNGKKSSCLNGNKIKDIDTGMTYLNSKVQVYSIHVKIDDNDKEGKAYLKVKFDKSAVQDLL